MSKTYTAKSRSLIMLIDGGIKLGLIAAAWWILWKEIKKQG